MLRSLLPLAALLLVLHGDTGAAERSDTEKAAVAAAEKWLQLVDGGKYAESWQEAAAYFRGAVTQPQWEQSLQGTRKPLGRLVSRKVKSTIFKTTMPGAPDGEYVVIEFETSMEHKREAVETVAPMREKDGAWRVSGYYIR